VRIQGLSLLRLCRGRGQRDTRSHGRNPDCSGLAAGSERTGIEPRVSQAAVQKGCLGSKNKAPAFDMAKAQEVVEQEEGELSVQEQLRCKIRYFSDESSWGAAALWKIIASG